MQECDVLFPNVPARCALLSVPQHAGPGAVPLPFDFYSTFDVDGVCSYIPAGIPVLLPASSWARDGLKKPCLPAHVTKRGADSGGFVASRIWGEYRYSLEQYVAWLRLWSPGWAATMDYCCEPELEVITRERQERTTCNAWQAWTTYRCEPFAWVPTLQGWLPGDYQRHAYEMKPLIEQMQAAYKECSAWRVGVGTLCRRDDVVMVQAILKAIREVLPVVPLHLWGIKLDALRSIDLTNVVSTDSAAWHGKFKGEIEETRRQAAQAQMSIRRYTITVKLPDYMEKVRLAVAESRQVMQAQQDTVLIEQVRKRLRASGGWTLDLLNRRNRRYAYAVRRQGKRRERVYLGPVSTLSTWLETFPACLAAEPSACPVEVAPLHATLWNDEKGGTYDA